MRSRGKGGGGLQGERESNKVMVRHGTRERADVQQDFVKTRLSWFPALWVGGEGESVGSNVVKKLVKSDKCNFSGWMLKSPRTTSGVPSSGKQLRRASISSKKSQKGPGGR